MNILLMMFMGAMMYLVGRGYGAKWHVSWLPQLLFAIPIGMSFAYTLSDHVVFYVLMLSLFGSIAWSFFWTRTGHADTLVLGEQLPDKPLFDNTLTKPTMFISKRFKFGRDSLGFDLIFLTLKGFLVTLPVGGTGLFLFPLVHYIGEHSPWKKDIVRDVLAGVSAALSVILFLKVF